ncbi:MAG: aminomethyl-transferring glycine dehydrogenase subunit GcvPB [Clostridiales bacterium]|nr:aminomethyl-transferring glycine dehydrogenase subunit GcvPB [Clostridiales bacterium]
MKKAEPLIFEISSPGRAAFSLPACDVPEKALEEFIPARFRRREAAELPEVSELDVVRHFTRLSQLNHGVESGFYPLGSCTMKYSPKVNENMSALPGFTRLHPWQPEESAQGALRLMYELERMLSEITGMEAFSLIPAAGAHGEMAGLMMIKAYHESRGDFKRGKIIVPDSAHGTNPASAMMVGLEVVEIGSDARGGVDLDALAAAMNDEAAGLMLTNPNTLGLFEENIIQIAEIVHRAGGLLYYDGANANAIMGISRPGDMGFDVVHLNLHKTFATPHGGGGPGAGPVGVKKDLVPFLPSPRIELIDGKFRFNDDLPLSVGRIKAFYGNFLVMVKAYCYILSMGAQGLKEVSQGAVLNANYVMNGLKEKFHLPYQRVCMHECVFSGKLQKEQGVSTLDMAKRLLDFGYHPPTIYFPLIVEEALMIEPTECESRATLDEFIAACLQIAEEAERDPEMVKGAPHTTFVRRLDEAGAARTPILRWHRR